VFRLAKQIDRDARSRSAEQQRLAEARAEGNLGAVDIRHGDFRRGLADIEDDTVDFILTNPPYGFAAVDLYRDLAVFAKRVLKPGGSLVCYTGQATLIDVGVAIGEHLRYWWTFSLEHSHGGQQLLGKHVIAEWKPLLWFVKEHRADTTFVADRIRGTMPDKSGHEWAQGCEELFDLIRQLTEPGDLIVDPFMGSGTTLVAAHMLGRNTIGCDIDSDHVATARERLS
jgi:SAM-dependent methyltransferase